MKIKYKFTAWACVALLAIFTSCSKDPVMEQPPVVEIPEGEPTYVQFSLTQDRESTRAGQISVKEPTADEKIIKKASLYCFNKTQDFIKKVDFTVSASGAVVTTQLSTGKFYFYVLVNCPGTAPDFPARTSLDAVTTHIDNTLTLNDNITAITKGQSGFMMSTIGDPAQFTLVASTQEEAAQKNNFVLYVGRAMAKVNLKFDVGPDDTANQPITGSLTEVEYQGAHNPKQMFELPNLFNHEIFIPMEPHKPLIDTTEKDSTCLPSNYFPELPDDFSMGGFITADGDPNTAIYMVENAHENPRVGNSSFALIKGTFSPRAGYCYSGANGTAYAGAQTGTFWIAATEDGNVYRKRFFFGQAPTAGVLAALTLELKDGNTYTQAVEYRDGKSYYAFYLKDESKTLRRTQYATARNNYYGITITSVKNLGSNTPAGVIKDRVPETPLGVDTWMHGVVEVLEWTTVAQRGKL